MLQEELVVFHARGACDFRRQAWYYVRDLHGFTALLREDLRELLNVTVCMMSRAQRELTGFTVTLTLPMVSVHVQFAEEFRVATKRSRVRKMDENPQLVTSHLGL